MHVLDAWHFSIDNSLCSPDGPSLFLSCLVAEPNQKIRNVLRQVELSELMHTVHPLLGFFVIMESMLEVHFRCWEIGVMAASEDSPWSPLLSPWSWAGSGPGPHQLFNVRSACRLVAVIDHRDDRLVIYRVQQIDREVCRSAVIHVEEEELWGGHPTLGDTNTDHPGVGLGLSRFSWSHLSVWKLVIYWKVESWTGSWVSLV